MTAGKGKSLLYWTMLLMLAGSYQKGLKKYTRTASFRASFSACFSLNIPKSRCFSFIFMSILPQNKRLCMATPSPLNCQMGWVHTWGMRGPVQEAHKMSTLNSLTLVESYLCLWVQDHALCTPRCAFITLTSQASLLHAHAVWYCNR